jgi:orotate phosphoribosyltransferase
VPFHSLVTLEVPSYAADQCPLCRDGVPIIKPGSRA